MKFNFYLLILLFVCLLLFKATGLSMRTPRKIRNAGIAVCTLVSLRYAALIALYITDNIIWLYLLKPIVYLQFIFVPVMGLVTTCIFLKRSKFSYIFAAMAILMLLYVFLILKLPINLEYVQGSGYVMNLQDAHFINWIYLAFNTIVFFASLILFKQKDMILLKLAAAFSMFELFMVIYGMPLLANPVLGELLWFVAFICSLDKVKKQA